MGGMLKCLGVLYILFLTQLDGQLRYLFHLVCCEVVFFVLIYMITLSYKIIIFYIGLISCTIR